MVTRAGGSCKVSGHAESRDHQRDDHADHVSALEEGHTPTCDLSRRRRAEPTQVHQQFPGGLVAIPRLLLETLQDHLLDLRREIVAQRSWRRRFLVDDVVDGGRGELLPEWESAGRHLLEHDAERPDVAALVGGLAQQLLRRHVGERAGERSGRPNVPSP
jgi:hypothetical protein